MPSLLFRCFSLFLPHLRTVSLAQEKRSKNCLRFGTGWPSLCLHPLLSRNIVFFPALIMAPRAKKKFWQSNLLVLSACTIGILNTRTKVAKLFLKLTFRRQKHSQALGRVMCQGNIPNSADFMASFKMYAVFHVTGCFKFKFTFYHVFSFKWVLISMLIWNGFVEHQNRRNTQSLLATEHAKLGLVINWVKFNYTLTSKQDNLTFHANVWN